MKKVIVLGAGMVGSVIALDLVRDARFEVAIADISESALEKIGKDKRVRAIVADLSDVDTVKKLVDDFDMVCGAMPSKFGMQTMLSVIESGKDFCDISFLPDDPSQLDSLAKKRGVCVVYDCGVAPGMSHMLVGYADSQCDELEDVKIYVGGIPRQINRPWFYKAAFAPSDVIEEYTRPVFLVENGEVVEKKALSDREMLEFPGAGRLEAFNTDGLRSLVKTIKVPNMIEKTLRYPGHIDLIMVLKDTGFFSKEPVKTDGNMIIPLELTEKLLFPFWKYKENEEDMTVMRVVVEGTRAGERLIFSWDMLDYYDRLTKTSSMARTTAFPCAIVARMIMSGEYRQEGVNPPESLGRVDGLLDKVLHELEGRGVGYLARVEGE
ncbi:MAG: saccharopine dehydrogenase C-terminal domain-containing protein [bacterium]